MSPIVAASARQSKPAQTAKRKTQSISARRIVFIDALRGAAACLVVVQHIADRLIASHSQNAAVLKRIFVDSFDAGRFGVALFFMISGFVIPFSIRGDRPIYNFLISRFFRLYPAYWVSLIGAYLSLLLFNHYAVPPFNLLINASMFEGALGVPVVLGPYWTLIIELTFYAACVILHYSGWLRARYTATVMFVTCLALCWTLALVGAALHRYYSANLLLNMSLMFFGLVLRGGDEAPAEKTSASTFLYAIGLCVSIMATIALTPDRHNVLATRLSFSSGYILAIVVFLVCQRCLTINVPVLVWLGSISYSVYLLHEIFLIGLEKLLYPQGGPLIESLFASLALLGSLLCGMIVYHLVELPSIKFGKGLLASELTS